MVYILIFSKCVTNETCCHCPCNLKNYVHHQKQELLLLLPCSLLRLLQHQQLREVGLLALELSLVLGARTHLHVALLVAALEAR